MDWSQNFPAPHEYPRQYPSNYTLPPAPYTHCSTAPIQKYCQPPMRALASFPLDDGIKSLVTNTNYTHYNYSPLYADTISRQQSSLTSNPSYTDNRGANKQYDTLQQGHCVIHYGDNQSEQGYIHYDLASTAVHKRRGRPSKNSIKDEIIKKIKMKLYINSVKITSPTKQQESTTPKKTSNNLTPQQAWADKTSNNINSQQSWPDKTSNNITPQQSWPDKTSNNITQQQSWPDKRSNNIRSQQEWPIKRRSKPIKKHVVNRGNRSL